MTVRHEIGRPLKFKTVEEMREKIVAYFAECEESKRPLTITGLALALGTDRDTLLDYQTKRGDAFSDTIKNAKLVCQNYAEEELFRKGHQVAGVIFNLKNNYGRWKEEQEIIHRGIKQLLDEIHGTDEQPIENENGEPLEAGGGVAAEHEEPEVAPKQSVFREGQAGQEGEVPDELDAGKTA